MKHRGSKKKNKFNKKKHFSLFSIGVGMKNKQLSEMNCSVTSKVKLSPKKHKKLKLKNRLKALLSKPNFSISAIETTCNSAAEPKSVKKVLQSSNVNQTSNMETNPSTKQTIVNSKFSAVSQPGFSFTTSSNSESNSYSKPRNVFKDKQNVEYQICESKNLSIVKPRLNQQTNLNRSPANLNRSRANLNRSPVNFNQIVKQRTSLPIYPYRNELLKSIKQNTCIVLIGETACGKTTQIPQYLLEDGLLKTGILGITQPRRVATITIAQRVSAEVGCELGGLVGYSIRFEDVTSPSTKLKYMTDGMLLRESILDPLLMRYRAIILDEAHERTIDTDILFGIVKGIQGIRKKRNMLPLKIIVMSATMDVDHFSKYFNNCPVFYLHGRQYPIQIMYAAKQQQDYVFSALVTAFQIHQKEPEGDILVFCTGQEEIESMVNSVHETIPLLQHGTLSLIAFPLYASLPGSEQLKVFQPTPKGHRKIIFSTNVAETSVTIQGIKYVIDTGKVKARTYHSSTGLDLLKVQKISKAQASQRSGRAGRESSGICYRLYTTKEYEKFLEHSLPEIQRCNLASVILQLLAIGIKDVAEFDFMDKPSNENIQSAINQLSMLGAVVSNITPKLTELGKKISTFPLEPKYGTVILMSKDYQCTDEVLTIVSMLSVETIFYTPNKKRDLAAAVRKKFESNEGDHVMLLNIYKGYKSSKGNQDWCRENFVNQRNMMQVINIRKQLSELCLKSGISAKSCGKELSNIRRCLVSGFFMNVAELQQGGEYMTIDTRQKVTIHPSSCLFNSKPSYVIFNELVQTSKCYMRNLCLVDPEWLKEAAPQYFNSKRLNVTNS